MAGRAWTSLAPALIAYRTRSPILFAETRRVQGGYRIRYSDPIWPDLTKPLDREVKHLMDQSLALLQESIRKNPGEWLWQHNRWKQPTPHNARKNFGYDCLSIILPPDPEPYLKTLAILEEIYHSHFVILLAPASWQNRRLMQATEIHYYQNMQQTLRTDYRVKQRELRGLLEAMEAYDLEQGLILTLEEEGEEEHGHKKITILPAWKWFLN